MTEETKDWFDSLKSKIRRYPRLYNLITWIVAPCWFPLNLNSRILWDCAPGKLMLNIGAGTTKYHPEMINLDIQNLSFTDIQADAHSLPVRSESLDAIISISTLEHVKNPQKVIQEMHRVLKPEGSATVLVPFLYGFHAAPYDFQRWTRAGLAEAFTDFREVRVEVASGPTSALLAVLHEWLAMLFSFGIGPLYRVNVIIFLLLCFPFKVFDIILTRFPMAENIACTFLVTARR